MSLKYKAVVLATVMVAIAAVLFLTNQDPVPKGEVESDQIAANLNGYKLEVASLADDDFKPADDPYQAYTDARQAGKPIVLEFYARW